MMKDDMTDKELDALLGNMQHVRLPVDFSDKLNAKLLGPAPSNVVAFPQKNPLQPASRRVWLSAIPLAASLAAGLYFGAIGNLPETLSGLEGTLISDSSDSLIGTGLEDTESFLNGDLS